MRQKISEAERKENEESTEPKPPATREQTQELAQQIWNNLNAHGIVVGILVTIYTNKWQQTTLFFADGYVQTTDIPMIGIDIEQKPEYQYNVLMAKKIIQMVPFLASEVENDYICTRGTDEELEESRSYGVTAYYIFRPPENGMIDVSKSIGIWTLDECIKTISEDEEESEFMPEVGAI